MYPKLTLVIYFLCAAYITQAQRGDFWDVNFYKADSIAALYANHSLKDQEKLVENLTKDLTTDVERFRVIFRWITDNIHYDYESYLEHQQQEEKLCRNRAALQAWRKRFIDKTNRRLVLKKLAICSGYSKLLTDMSSHAGFQCVTISGYGRTGSYAIGKGRANHAWNAIQINNRWYLCDPTWASSSLDASTLKFIRRFDKHYFLTDPSLFIANHYPSDTSWTLLYNKPTLQEFLHAPMKHTGYIANKVSSYFPTKGILTTKKETPLRFEFTSNSDRIEPAPYLLISASKNTPETRERMLKDSQGRYAAKHVFVTRGNYKVQVVINDQIALRYNVNVN